ncbi:MAG: InlB B-repeat-containing protein, partial [Lachnospiraceae bacterium]|nr:InlB B-repeat-containing protein [Lachnospiraceae bacterium]
MRKRLRLKKMVSALLAVAMIGQSCLVTTAGDLTDDAVIVAMQEQAAAEEAAARKAAEEKAAQEAAAAQKAAEEKAAQEAAAAQKAAEEKAAQEAAAAQKAAEEKAAQEAAAAQKAAEEAAAQKAAEDAAAQKAAEDAAAQKAAEDAAAQKAAEEAAAQKAAEDAAAQKAAEEKAAQEITYRVTFEAHAADYGSIYVRGESGPIASVSSYYKEVKENGSFAFTIHANDGYEVEHVRYADTNAELPKNAQGAYEIAAVTRNVKVVVTYKIVPQETADAAVETEADEGQTEAPTDESETEEDREAETEVGTENTAEESTEAESEYETEPGTEAESETESESEKEIAMPEFHYNGVCNGIAVAIRAPEGVFPEGTKAVLAAPSAESLAAAAAASGQNASDLMGVDITFRYDGKEIQPTSAVEVSFRAAEIADADISNVYHVSDGGAVQEVTASKSGASLGFTADSFSTWIFPTAGGAVAPASILDPETSIATYVFTADGETVDTQYITNGDTLSEPAAPVKEGYRFIGWYVGETPVIFGTVSTVSKTEEIIVEARFEEVHYVFFHNPGGAVVATKEGIAGAKITTSDVTFAVGAEESITGWYEASDYSGSAVESVTLSDSNRDLYAKVENGFWVTYDSDGGSYVAPEFYPAGETAALSAQPTKNGYSFEGWYDGDARVNSTTMSVSVKAKWKENSSADYRVIYWQQKVTDDKNATDAQKTYAYVATETKAGRPGTTMNASSITKSYNGFTKNTVNSKSVTIAADGSTIMNVYYDRVLCTVNYYVWEQKSWGSGEWKIGKTVTGLYGANLKEGEWWTDYYWYTHKNGGNGCILLTSYDFKTAGYANNAGNISSDGVVTTCNFYGTRKETGGKVYYYNEQADGSFKLVNTVTTGGGTLTIHQKYAGYDLYKYTTGKIGGEPTTAEFWKDKKSCKDGDSTDKKTVHIASKLQSFRLDYSNGGEVQHHETVKYTASLNGYDAKFTPTTRPATVDANYTFDGWYSDPECTKKFDFNTTMPATNVVVYAGWKAPEVRVTAHRSPEDTTGVNVEVAYGESVDEHLLPTILYDAETQEFLGWFTRNADGSYRPWDFSTKIYSDVDLYARVISKGTFKVFYDANGGKGTVEDGRAYAQGAKADVKAITGITAPTGKTFLYWSLNADGSGKKYYPNNTIEIEGDITLYAIWGDTTTTSLTYDGNSGATSDGKIEVVVSGLKNNQKVKAEGAIFTRTGYKFIGWSTKSDATAAEYAAGADVIVHADETVNVLYAVWEIRKDYRYTVHYYWNDTTEKAAEDKVVTNQTYNETITESPIAIEGYTPVNSGSQEMVIDAENKTITFYYYKNVGLTANSDTKVYNGQEQSVSGFTGAPEGADFSAIQVGAKGTDAGEYLAAFAEGTIGTVDKTEKYIVKGATDGKLTIKPVADEVVVTIEGNHDSKVYDGTEHVVTGYEVTEISNVLYTKDNFSFSGNAEAKRTAVGKTDMGLTAANFKNESANFSNVTFKVTDGYMEITPAGDAVVVTIEGNNASAVYDGAEHKVTGYTVVSISNKLYKESDFSFSGTAEAKR